MHGRRTDLALAVCGALVLTTATALDVGAAAARLSAPRVHIQPADASAELVVNGNAESTSPGSVPGWQIAGTAETVKYGASGFPSAASPGPSDRGKRFFGGGNSASSRLEQFVDLTPFASQIETGKVQAQVSAYLGGFGKQNDHVDLVVRENQMGTSSQPVFTVAGPPSDTRNSITSLLHEQGDFALSKKATFLDVSLEFTRASGTYDDGYADDVSIKLINLNGVDPPPSAPAGAGVELLQERPLRRGAWWHRREHRVDSELEQSAEHRRQIRLSGLPGRVGSRSDRPRPELPRGRQYQHFVRCPDSRDPRGIRRVDRPRTRRRTARGIRRRYRRRQRRGGGFRPVWAGHGVLAGPTIVTSPTP